MERQDFDRVLRYLGEDFVGVQVLEHDADPTRRETASPVHRVYVVTSTGQRIEQLFATRAQLRELRKRGATCLTTHVLG